MRVGNYFFLRCTASYNNHDISHQYRKESRHDK